MLILMLMMEEDGNFYRMRRFVVSDLHCCPPLDCRIQLDSNLLLNLSERLQNWDMPDVVNCCNVNRFVDGTTQVVSNRYVN